MQTPARNCNWLRALALVGGVWLLLALTWPLDAIHPDATRDLLAVRDCLELQRCDTAGPTSSWRAVHQGALWLDVLALARTFWTPWGVGLAVALLNALAIAVTVRWLLARHPAARAILPLLLVTALLATPVVLVMPTAMWPLSLLATCLLLQTLEAPGVGGFMLVGVLLGLCADLHLAAWPLVWTAACVLWHRGLRLGAGLLLLPALLTTFAVSPRAWELLVLAVQERPDALLGLLGLPLVWLLLRRVRAWPAERQLALVGLLVWLASGLAHQFAARYAFAFSGALLLVLAPLLAQRPVAIWGLRLGVALLCLWRVQWGGEALTYRAVQAVATVARANNLGWPDVLTGLRGRRAPVLAEASALFLPLAPLPRPRPVSVLEQDGFVSGARATTPRLALADAAVCWPPQPSGQCVALPLAPGPHATPLPFAGRAVPTQLPVPAPFVPFQLRIPVRAGRPTSVIVAPPGRGSHYLLRAPDALRGNLQPAIADEPCDWRFANGSGRTDLDAAAQTLTLTCGALRHPGDQPPRLLPGIQESCALTDSCEVRGNPLPLPEPRRMDPLPEPLRFNRTAGQARTAAALALGVLVLAVARLVRRRNA